MCIHVQYERCTHQHWKRVTCDYTDGTVHDESVAVEEVDTRGHCAFGC